jgi:hypothetical protein
VHGQYVAKLRREDEDSDESISLGTNEVIRQDITATLD